MLTVFSRQVMIITAIAICTAQPTSGRTFYVDPCHPDAADENSGTEDSPWQTLNGACQQAVGGDLVWVKVGIFHETLRPTSDGITFAVFGDDSVVIQAPIYAISTDSIQTCNQHEGCFTFTSSVADPRLIVNDKAAMKVSTAAELVQRPELEIPRYYTHDGQIHLFVHSSSHPSKLEVLPREFRGVDLQVDRTTIRGFEIIDCHTGVYDQGQRNLIEDCVARETWSAGFTQRGVFGILRRCTAVGGFRYGFNTGDSIGVNVIEECIAVRIRTDLPNRVFRDPETPLWAFGHPFRTGNSNYNVYRHNIAGDSGGKGWWPDVNVYGCSFYGNSVFNNRQAGVYNEYPANDSRILYNAIERNDWGGLSWRFCQRALMQYNYVANNDHIGIKVLYGHVARPGPRDNIIARNIVLNHKIAVQQGTPRNLKDAQDVGAPVEEPSDLSQEYHQELTNTDRFSDNVYSLAPDGMFYEGPFGQIKTLAEYQRITGNERGSRMGTGSMEDFGLGLYTVRVPESSDPARPVSIVANPVWRNVHWEPLPFAGEDDPYFWRIGYSDYDYQLENLPHRPIERGVYGYWYQWPGHEGRHIQRTIGQRRDAVPNAPLSDDDEPRFWLQAEGLDPEGLTQEAAGWWSPALPTVPGAKIRIHMRVMADALEPISAKVSGIVAWVRFVSLTGTHVTRELLFQDAEKRGTFDWDKREMTITASEHAGRFALFFGIGACNGIARFADIRIETLPGETGQ
ncbi:hypothetical protein ACFL6S_29375 [Candidatus Poribacteria bacterium]